MLDTFPENLSITATFRFPFRNSEDTIASLHTKFQQISRRLNEMDGVEDVWYEEDEPFGLSVEVEIKMKSRVFQTPMSSVYAGITKVLATLYNIEECY